MEYENIITDKNAGNVARANATVEAADVGEVGNAAPVGNIPREAGAQSAAEGEKGVTADKLLEARENARKTFGLWGSQALEARGEFENFDFAVELENPAFKKLLRAGVGVCDAYRTLHYDELIKKAASEAVDGIYEKAEADAEKAVVESIRARGMRPVENGIIRGGGMIMKTDVSKLTPGQRKEYIERAMLGETIGF